MANKKDKVYIEDIEVANAEKVNEEISGLKTSLTNIFKTCNEIGTYSTYDSSITTRTHSFDYSDYKELVFNIGYFTSDSSIVYVRESVKVSEIQKILESSAYYRLMPSIYSTSSFYAQFNISIFSDGISWNNAHIVGWTSQMSLKVLGIK